MSNARPNALYRKPWCPDRIWSKSKCDVMITKSEWRCERMVEWTRLEVIVHGIIKRRCARWMWMQCERPSTCAMVSLHATLPTCRHDGVGLSHDLGAYIRFPKKSHMTLRLSTMAGLYRQRISAHSHSPTHDRVCIAVRATGFGRTTACCLFNKHVVHRAGPLF